MASKSTQTRLEYLELLKQLYSEVRSWLPASSFEVAQDTTSLNEAAVGRYQAPVLRIWRKDRTRVASLVPKGARIIGARGQVDLAGPLDLEPILYLSTGGPTITSATSTKGEEIERYTRPFLKGVEREGWYYVEDADPSIARPFGRDAFLDLLERVGGYAARESA